MRRFGHQHRQISGRSAQHLVEQLVGALDRRHVGGRGATLAMGADQSAGKRRLDFFRCVAADRDEHPRDLSGRQDAFVVRLVSGKPGGWRIERNGGVACRTIEALVVQRDLMTFDQRAARCATPLALEAADLEHVCKIAVEAKIDPNLDRLAAMVAYAEFAGRPFHAKGTSFGRYAACPSAKEFARYERCPDWSGRRSGPNCRRGRWTRAAEAASLMVSSRRDRNRVSL